MSASRTVGFPVARVHGECADETIIGSAFYVMDMVEGRIFWDTSFPGVSRDERPRYFDAMNATLATLHKIDYRAIGLADYGRPVTIASARSSAGRANTYRMMRRGETGTWIVS